MNIKTLNIRVAFTCFVLCMSIKFVSIEIHVPESPHGDTISMYNKAVSFLYRLAKSRAQRVGLESKETGYSECTKDFEKI